MKYKFFTEEEMIQAEKNGINRNVLRGRLKSNWDKERAITKRLKPARIDWEDTIMALYKGEEFIMDGNVFEIAEQLGIAISTCKGYYHKSYKDRTKGNALSLVVIGKYSEEEEEE